MEKDIVEKTADKREVAKKTAQKGADKTGGRSAKKGVTESTTNGVASHIEIESAAETRIFQVQNSGVIEMVSEAEATSSKKRSALNAQVEKSRSRQKNYTLDLRVRTPASLGYINIEGLDTAQALVKLAETKGIDVIGITDLFSGSFIDKIVDAAKGRAITVIPGVELRATLGGCNDVVLTCLFPESYSTSHVDGLLQRLGIPVEARRQPNYVVSTPFEQILQAVEAEGGVVLPSRMDKTPNRQQVIPQLVEKYGFRCFDLAYSDSQKYFKDRWPKVKFQLFSFSNANALAQVGSRIGKVKMNTPSFAAIKEVVGRETTSS